jgi:nitroreductase
MMMDFYDVIKTRLSIRQYKLDPVEDEKLARVLEAARIAPSAANRQPWHYIVIRDEETKHRLKDAYDQEWFYTAPVIICACADPAKSWVRKDGREYVDVDVSISFDHLVLAATAEGLGTCWIAAFDPKVVSEVLGIPDGIEPLLLTPLGYPAVTAQPRERRALDEIVHWERWSAS